MPGRIREAGLGLSVRIPFENCIKHKKMGIKSEAPAFDLKESGGQWRGGGGEVGVRRQSLARSGPWIIRV